VLVQLKPWTDPPFRLAPFGLTEPELNSPEIVPPEMTKRSVALPQGEPRATETHVPSKFPPPPAPSPPLLREARRGSSDSGLARRVGFEGSTARGASREPDSDFSSLPMLPPALPDCAIAAQVGNAAAISHARRAILVACRIASGIMTCSRYSDACALSALLLCAFHRPVHRPIA
jgi:hypothetical protein